MKKQIYAFSAIASAVLMAASCQMAELEEIQDNGKLEMYGEAADGNFNVTFDCSQTQTRTEFHENTIWWSAGDQVLFGQYTKVDGKWTLKTTSNSGLSKECASFNMTVSSFNAPALDTTTAYFSIYPKDAYKAFSAESGIPIPRIKLNEVQAPNAASFDPKADLLVSQLVLSEADTTATFFKLRYTRPGSIGKMAITNLPSSESIETIKLRFMKAGVPFAVAGSRYYDLAKGTVDEPRTNSNCIDLEDLTLDYTNCEIAGDMTAYFICYPFELGNGDSFTVEVRTKAGETFTKYVSLGAEDALRFEASKATQFTVDMSSAITTGVDGFKVNIFTTGVKNIYCAVEGDEIASFKRAAYIKDSFLALTPEEQSAKLDSANEGTPNAKVNFINLNENTSYIIAAKITDKSGKTFIIMKEAATSWFGMRSVTRSTGGIQIQISGRNLAYGTKAYKTVRTSDIVEGTNLEEFYMNTIKPANYAQSVLDAIMAKDGETINYAVTTDYLGNELIPDESYTLMMKAVSLTGQVRFMACEAIAK